MVTKRTETLTDDELIARYIAPHPTKPGADQAIIAGHGVSVWALVGYLRGTGRARNGSRRTMRSLWKRWKRQ
ncbi:MAG: hypothetical protein ACR2M3_04255 [Thermomicrobiales bacterium]